MKDHPILFNSEMVRAVLDGRKTQTRRVFKAMAERNSAGGWLNARNWVEARTGWWADCDGLPLGPFKCPYGKVGDRLWARETFWQWGSFQKTTETCNKLERPKERFVPAKPIYGSAILFDEPDHKPADRYHLGYHKRPSIFMPRWASRITLEITAIRVERVKSISNIEAKAEGITVRNIGETPYCAFRLLWGSINEKRGYGWKKNPWVWVVEFKVIK